MGWVQLNPTSFTPLPASAEDLRTLAERVEGLEQRVDNLDERVVGSTAWLVQRARTVTLMTANEGMELLRWAVNRYDGRQGERRG
jgi:hypothetical protein